METSKKSFWELIADYTINIPIIQRDYAQGRIEEKEKRDKFLEAIFRHLTRNEYLDLDFIYGRINEKVFYPIDGQQRLTTLFLLHWYASLLGKIEESEKNNLIKFVYNTRISSREFCNALIIEKIEIPSTVKDDNFIAELQNRHWFRSVWKKDPTIKAMLTMIQAIHGVFIRDSSTELWDKLTKKRLITFQVLDLGSKGFELTDELYIKMNARGKQLTPFENFKANFIQFIEKTFKDEKLQHPIRGNISYAGYFAYKIEKEWMDLFWVFRDESKVIDNLFMNYIGYIAQMCFFQSNKSAKAEDFLNNIKQFEEIFKIEENLLFLFNSLDKIYDIASNNGIVEKINIQKFFELIFQKGPLDNSREPKVRLFWNSSEIINLFESCINKGLDEDQRNKIILYVTIHYLLKHNSTEVNDGIRHYIRVIRNLLQATRQRNDTRYNTNVRINNWGNYWSLFKQLETEDVYQTLQLLITESFLNYERIKAKIILDNDAIKPTMFSIEEFNNFGGLIHQLKPQDNIDKLRNYSSTIREVWDSKVSDTLIIQALIACDFPGMHIKDCKMGEMWYFGKKGNWSVILTNEQDEISKSIILLCDRYLLLSDDSAENRLKAIVENWLTINKDDRSWKYYFMKYSDFVCHLNYYAFHNDYEIRVLGSDGSNPLLAYHINPFVRTVCILLNDPNICEGKYCYQQYTGNSPLKLKNGVTLTSTLEGWLIDCNTFSLPNEIVDKYKLIERDNRFILKEFDGKDRIEIACDFIKDLVQ